MSAVYWLDRLLFRQCWRYRRTHFGGPVHVSEWMSHGLAHHLATNPLGFMRNDGVVEYQHQRFFNPQRAPEVKL